MKRNSSGTLRLSYLAVLRVLTKSEELNSYEIAGLVELDLETTIVYLTRLEKLGYIKGQIKPGVVKGSEGLIRYYHLTSKAYKKLSRSQKILRSTG